MSDIVIQDNKNVNIKKQKILLFLGVIVSIIVIVSLILFVTKLLPRNIMMHVFYPGLALNILINGFTMLGYNKKKIAIVDFIFSGIVLIFYILTLIF